MVATENAMPPMWNMGSAVQIRSSGVRKKRVSLVPAANRMRASWREQCPLGLGRGARGVHHHGRVTHLDQLPAALEVAVGHSRGRGGEIGLGGEPGRDRREAVPEHDDLPQLRRVRQGQARSGSWLASDGNAAASRPVKSGAPGMAGSGGLVSITLIREWRMRSASSRLL